MNSSPQAPPTSRNTGGPSLGTLGSPSTVIWVAILMVIGLFLLTREPSVRPATIEAMANRFQFDIEPIETETYAPRPVRSTREVHPSLERIRSWISGTGAAATLADLDRDGLYNDLLLVDPRLNTLLIQPVANTGERFAPFTLDPTGVAFNPSTMAPTGSLVSDFNEDGLEDILVYYWGRTPVVFIQQPATEPDSASQQVSFRFKSQELINPDADGPKRWFTHAATQADIDGDGHLDLLLGNFLQDGADILNPEGTGVVTVMQAGKSNARNGGGAKLFLWTPPQDRTQDANPYRDHSDALEKHCGKGWVLAMGAVDLDPDNTRYPGLPEIYIAHDFGLDRLLHNRSSPGHPEFALCEGKRDLTTPKSFVLGRDSFKGMGLDFGDINGDGLFDIYVSNIADDFALHEGHFVFVSTGQTQQFEQGIAPYRQQSSALGLVRGGWVWIADSPISTTTDPWKRFRPQALSKAPSTDGLNCMHSGRPMIGSSAIRRCGPSSSHPTRISAVTIPIRFTSAPVPTVVLWTSTSLSVWRNHGTHED